MLRGRGYDYLNELLGPWRSLRRPRVGDRPIRVCNLYAFDSGRVEVVIVLALARRHLHIRTGLRGGQRIRAAYVR